jgi:hypothetical protein
VRAWAAGYQSALVEVELGEAQRHVVALPALQPLPIARQPVEPSASTEPVAERTSERERSRRLGPLPVALFGGGLALVVGGIVSGQVSSAKRDELRRGCTGVDPDTGQRLCGPDLAGTRQSMKDLALLADVAWIGGVLLAGAGVTVFLLDDGAEQPAGIAVGCFMGGCGLSTEGRF